MAHRRDLTLLPPGPGVCPQCAVEHEPHEAHNAQSIYYQYSFYAEHGRWPTWRDAIAHCEPDLRALWEELLLERGVTLDGSVNPP